MKYKEMMPSFEGVKPVGRKMSNRTSPIQVVLFWSMSCAQCKTTFDIIRMLEDMQQEIDIIVVHMPRNDEDKNSQKVLKQYKAANVTAPLFMDEELILSNRFGNRFVPSVYIFHHGSLRFSQAGMLNRRQILSRIEKFLK